MFSRLLSTVLTSPEKQAWPAWVKLQQLEKSKVRQELNLAGLVTQPGTFAFSGC